MKTEIKEKWVAALRCDKFKQGKGFLRSDATGTLQHCCLGVLTEIYCEETGISFKDLTEGIGEEYLPSEVRDWAGLNLINPEIMVQEKRMSCSEANDTYELSFNQIAEAIEKSL
jgi:hypothetical protein